jgi:hypothetical protein
VHPRSHGPVAREFYKIVSSVLVSSCQTGSTICQQSFQGPSAAEVRIDSAASTPYLR